ncbi:MAG: type II toxin-antitoxin system CcdA family antitoxin [Deltaproteobacteria bacterium]|nr:type II toxin-antitoxin system CcdA family antitoxin [Deltaproteobacteria bacterium]
MNLSVDSDLRQAHEVSARPETRAQPQAHWLEDDTEAIDAYNAHVARDGVFSDDLRQF